MVAEPSVRVEVAYAPCGEQVVIPLVVPTGTTAVEAIALSGITQRYPELDATSTPIGIYGKIVSPETILRERDRIEIYRPLVADPKQARRRRAGRVI